MYGDIYINDHGKGDGLDVTVDLGNGKFAKLYTDPEVLDGWNQVELVEDALAPKYSGAKLIWSRANA